MKKPITTSRVDGLLPEEARKWLMEAAKIDNPQRRIREIERVMQRIRIHYPGYLLEEETVNG